jgi:putative phosphotransacetylase
MKVPIEISARHIHISKKDLYFLFGKNYKLKKLRDLTQPGEFAAKETVEIINNKKKLRLRIIGPERENTQVELSISDALFLNMNIPLRLSGNIKNTPGVCLKNKNKKINIKQGVIIPLRHIHCSLEEAKKYNLKNKTSVLIKGKRGILLNNVYVRAKKDYKFCLHLDTDEGNSCNIIKKGKGELI